MAGDPQSATGGRLDEKMNRIIKAGDPADEEFLGGEAEEQTDDPDPSICDVFEISGGSASSEEEAEEAEEANQAAAASLAARAQPGLTSPLQTHKDHSLARATEKSILKLKAHDDSHKTTAHLVVETDFDDDEKVEVSMDVYNITIVANMTNALPPVVINQCLRLCVVVFIIQTTLAYHFFKDYAHFRNFQPFLMQKTALRLICSVLL